MKYFLLFLVVFSYILESRCEYKLVFADEFNGNSLDTSVWNIDSGDKWYNNELQAYTAKNVFVEDGALRIEAKRESYLSKSYTSGRINSAAKKFFTYGRFEARMKFPIGKGFWPAFWLWPERYYSSSYKEIDIMEAIGSLPKTIFSTCWGGPESNLNPVSKEFILPENYDLDYHVYFAVWKPGVIEFGVDDKVFFSCSPSNMKVYEFDNLSEAKFHIILNLAVGGDWPGSPTTSTVFPNNMYVDWVRVYQDDGKPASTTEETQPEQEETQPQPEETQPQPEETETQPEEENEAEPGEHVPEISGEVECSDYSSASLKNGVHYSHSVGKVDIEYLDEARLQTEEECCQLCGETGDCMAYRYRRRKCVLYYAP